ncbi:MAG: hypothetical protein OXI50_04275 [Gammaproteobacteria bacterium]|nr:hypothetical protein [Gammaproteobacteria bacterium]
MRGAVETGDGIRAWLFLRCVPEYEAAWRARAGPPAALNTATEPGGQAFPIRVQTRADLAAARFDLLAWQDPLAGDGPASPFWIQDAMPEAAVATDAPPLAGLVAAGGGAIEGLRLLDGDLVLKIEHDGRAVQILLRDAGPFPEGAGIELRHPFGLRMPHGVRRLLDFWQVAGRSPPPR